MIEIVEGNLAFAFPDNWLVVKYDGQGSFVDRRCKIPDTKRVDILALGNRKLHLIEVKDFRGHAIENKHRLRTNGNNPLHIEVAKKVRDTLALLVAAYRDEDTALQAFCKFLFGDRVCSVEVILFLEEDNYPVKAATRYRHRPDIEHALNGLLKPFGFRCHVQRRLTLPDGSPWKVRGGARP